MNFGLVFVASLFVVGVLGGCENKQEQAPTTAASSMESLTKQVESAADSAKQAADEAAQKAAAMAEEAKRTAESAMTANQNAADAQAAIENSKTLGGTDEQLKYLLGQAQGFLSQSKMNDVMTIAQYILSKLDPSNPDAQALLDKVKGNVTETVSGMADKLKGFGQ